MLANAIINALLNFLLFGGIPLMVYVTFQKLRNKRSLASIAERAGLRIGDVRYAGLGLAIALALAAAISIWPPPVAPLIKAGSAQQAFLGLSIRLALPMALLYGVIQSGLTEEILFRGLIAGSIARRLPLIWANLLQASLFLAPHLLLLSIMPELWGIMPLIFVFALVAGWLRARSGSIVPGWLIHSSVNVTVCLSVAIRTAAG